MSGLHLLNLTCLIFFIMWASVQTSIPVLTGNCFKYCFHDLERALSKYPFRMIFTF